MSSLKNKSNKYRHTRIACGLCPGCGRTNNYKSHCKKCSIRKAARMAALRAKKKLVLNLK